MKIKTYRLYNRNTDEIWESQNFSAKTLYEILMWELRYDDVIQDNIYDFTVITKTGEEKNFLHVVCRYGVARFYRDGKRTIGYINR